MIGPHPSVVKAKKGKDLDSVLTRNCTAAAEGGFAVAAAGSFNGTGRPGAR
jgi:hypothetical protein